ncbi:acetamidase/formamidase family protein [Streptomyces sp. NPDC000987]|uniref:acetamidase/formamidase family protein n=1 Tax=Streptomyces sp. NPDC000987 TaxID=3154374 RepID=UPI0033244F73
MHLQATDSHNVWDNSLPPVLTVAPGDTVTVETQESSGGQLDRRSTAGDAANLDFGRLNPVTGPIRIDGAEPGDTLVIDVLDTEVDDWGWTACIPGFGLLADDFPEAHLRIVPIEGGRAELLPGLGVPVLPMIGTIGVAVPEPGEHSVVPPRRWGGNMDIRQVGPGARLRLPVGVEGALLSLGDVHAAMGDGEVCGTGVETSATVRLRVGVEKGSAPLTPILETAPAARRTGAALVTTGIGPDLMTAAREATRQLIDEVVRRTGIDVADAYLLASIAGDLVISEIVDMPNWVVSIHLDRSLLARL